MQGQQGEAGWEWGLSKLPPLANTTLEGLGSWSEANELVGLLEASLWRTAIWEGVISKGQK